MEAGNHYDPLGVTLDRKRVKWSIATAPDVIVRTLSDVFHPYTYFAQDMTI